MTLPFASYVVLDSDQSNLKPKRNSNPHLQHVRKSATGFALMVCCLVATLFGCGVSPEAFGSNGTMINPAPSSTTSTTTTQAVPTVSQFFCTSGSALGAATDTCTVYLSKSSTSEAISVDLTSNNSAVKVPAKVTVAEGATSVQFTADLAAVGTTQTAVMTAATSAGSKTYQVKLFQAISTLTVPAPNVTFKGYVPLKTTVSMPVNVISSGTVPLTISSAQVTGEGFHLSGASFPMTLKAGEKATFTVDFEPTTDGSTSGQIAFVSNSSSGTKVTTLSGLGGAPPVSQFVCKTGSALGAAEDVCTVYLSGAAASGPTRVSLTSNDPAAKVPASIILPAGGTSGQFTANLAAVPTTQSAVITATAGSNSKTYDVKLFQAVTTLKLQNSSVTFAGYVPLKSTVSMPINVTSSGTMPLTITAAKVTGAGFHLSGATFPMTLKAGSKTTFTVDFVPAVAGSATGQVEFLSDSSSGSEVTTLSALGGAPPVSQFVCKSGSALGTATDVCTVYLSGASATGPVTVNLSSSDPNATVPATITLPVGTKSGQFTANLAPAPTTRTAVLSASAGSNSMTYSVTLFQAVTALTVQNPTISFAGYVPLNTSASMPISVLSSGTLPLTITAAKLTGTGFHLSNATFPMTLKAGQKTTFTVTFDPTAAGSSTGQVAFSSNASTGTTVATLSALGGAPPVSQFLCRSGSALGAAANVCTVYLSAAAQSGSVAVNLSSSNPAVTVPAKVTVPAGATSTQFTANMTAVSSTQSAVLSASAGSGSQTVQLTLFQASSALLVLSPAVTIPGYIPVNTTASQSISLLSSGTVPLTINSASITGAGFRIAGSTFPMTLPAGQTKTLVVQFAPLVPGSVSGSLTLQTNSVAGGTTVIPLSGIGSPTGKFPGSPIVNKMIPPTPTTAIPSTFFGTTIYYLAHYTPNVPAVLTPFPSFPVGTLRLWDVDYWANLEVTQGKYTWTKMDGDIATGTQNGVKDFIFTFGQTPQWASTNPTDPCPQGEGPGTCSPPNMAAYDDLATQVVQRYCGKVKYYEPWNEPNNLQFWDGNNAQMLAMAKDLYTIAKDPANCGCTEDKCSPGGGVNPNKVLLPPIGSAAPASIAWLDTYLADAKMANPYVDIAAFHGYVWRGYQPEMIVSWVQQLRQTLDKYGIPSADLWNTEASTEYDYYYNDKDQASWLMRSYAAEAVAGVSHFVWYAYDSCTWGTLYTSGMCANNQVPANQTNTAGAAYGVMEGWLSGASMPQCQQYQSGLWACELKRTGGYDAWMLWSTTGGNISVAMPSDIGLTTYRDSLNNINSIPSTLTVTPMPMLLEQ